MKIKKKGLSLLLALVVIMSTVMPTFAAEAGVASVTFPDMDGHWAEEALVSAIDNGLLNGIGGYMQPDSLLTRAQLAAVVNRAFGATEEATLPAGTDVRADAWYTADMRKAVQMGTFTGDPSGKLRPGDPITRQEAFAVLARAFKISSGIVGDLAAFSDLGQVSSWAEKAVAGLVKMGYVAGSNGKLSPVDNITRAQFATIMHRMVAQYITEAGTYEKEGIASEGSVLVRSPGVTLKNLTIRGDIIIGDGVGDGDVTLDGVKVEGRTVIRGGGENSIRIVGNSSLGTIIVTRIDGIVRVVVSGGAEVEVIYIDDGSDDVILEGSIGDVFVDAADIAVTAANATISSLNVNNDNTNIVIGSGSVVGTLTVSTDTSGVSLSNAGTIDRVETNAPTTVTGQGTIREAIVAPTGSSSSFDTAPASTTVQVGASAYVGGQTVDNTSGSGPRSVSAQPLAGNGGGGGDTTAPNFDPGYPKAGAARAVGSRQVEILVRVNENGTAYYVVVSDGTAAPSATQVMAGNDSTGAAALGSANAAVTANTEKSFVTAVLPADATIYDVYVVVKDGSGNATVTAKVDVTTPVEAPDTVINIAAIQGVTAPVRGTVPVATITETAQYTGTVAWNPAHNPFGAETIYTAIITLTAKAGFTLTGVAENFFTAAGATSDTNAVNSGVITAVFPATEAAPIVDTIINIAAIQGVTAPVRGAVPVTTITETAQYTGTVAWAPANNPFGAETIYTATITLTAKAGFTLTGMAENFFTAAGATSDTNAVNSGVITAVFPATEAAPIVDTIINIAAIQGVTAPVRGAVPVTTITETVQYTGTVAWNPAHNPFGAETIYTAIITLTAKAGFTLTGVAADYFTAAGAASDTNAVNSGVITAVFPVTEAAPIVDTIINIAVIQGVTAPVRGAVPVTTITETAQYTGTVAWDPADNPFGAETIYTATITLTAKAGFTLTGVAADYFTAAGSTSDTNAINSGVLTAVFPVTEAAPIVDTIINIAVIQGVTAPVRGAVPVTTITETAQYTGTVAWDPADNPFGAETIYTATITLTAKAGFTLTGVAADYFTAAGAASDTNAVNSGVITAVFPATEAAPIVDTIINIAAIQGVTAPVRGAVPVTTITETAQYTGTVAWNPAHNPFGAETIYTATITLTAKAGFTLTGVAENFFTVAGATSDTNAENAGVIIAVFPETATVPNVQLTGLTENLTADLVPGFAGGTYAYTLAATNGEAAVNITSTLAEATITWDVNTDANPAAAVASGVAAAIPLTVGANIITVHVEKEGTTARDYTITVTRAALLPDVQLTGLTEGLAADFNPVFVGETYAYTLAATNIEEEVNIMPTLAGSTITWNVDTDGEDDPTAVNSGVWAIIPLAFGNNVITIHVEKMGTTAKDYVITVMRENVLLPDVELTGLTENLAANFNHAFEGGRYAYELAAAGEEAVSIVPTLEGARITWDVDTDLNPVAELSSGETATIPLMVGDNYIFIHVEKEGTTAKTYTINVTRDIQLTGLTENLAEDFVPAFTGGTYEYTLAADNLIGVMSFTPTLDGATITWDVNTDGEANPTAVNSGTAVVIGLAPGPNVITIHVEKAAALPRDYVITVTREILPDVRLAGMTENLIADFNPAFAGDTYAYTLAATDTEATVDIVPMLGGEFVSISWDVNTDEESPTEINSNETATIPLEMGVNIITIHVENLGATDKDYVITVNRDAPLPDIQLTALTENLAADFDPAFAGGTYAYTLAATSAEETVNIVPTLAEATITWNVNTDGVANPTQVDSGAAATIPLALEDNIITIHVEKAGTTAKNYVITATRAVPLPVQLTGLTVNLMAELNPAFAGGTYIYALAAANIETAVNIVPTLAGATITWNVDTDGEINPTAVNSGVPAEIPLALGPNFITIHVEKAWTVAKDYYITVTRAGLPNVELTGLTENLTAEFNPAFAGGTYVYELAAANGEETVNIVPMLGEATITWDISTDDVDDPTAVNSGESAVIPLKVGYNVITIHVVKAGTTAKNYQIQVTRAMPFPDVQLTGLTEDLAASFNPAFVGSRYTYNLPATYNEAAVNIVPALDGATITWDVNTDVPGPTTVISGATAVIPLAVGANTITIHVEKAETAAKDYVIGVTRATPPDVQLTGLTENLAADFNAPFVGSFYTYTLAAANAETTVDIIPALAGATITWNVDTDGETDPTPVDSGATAEIPLVVGANVITIHVEKVGTSAKDYVITATRNVPLPVQLTGLAENLTADFNPAFEGEVYTYNLDAAGDETTVSIVPILAGATITWNIDTDGEANPTAVNSGSAAAIPLAAGLNVITIHVEKEFTAAKNYIINVIRNAPLPDVQLTGLTEDLEADFNPAFAGGTYAYTLAATDDEDSVDITPILDGATITWNVNTDVEASPTLVNSGATATIPLAAGISIITIHVEKAGTSDKDYTITVSRGDVTPPGYTTVNWSNGDSTLTVVFTENIYCTDAATLKAAITFAGNGTDFVPLADGDNITIIEQTLVIDFASPVTGTENRIRILSDTLRDAAGNVLHNQVITHDRTAPVYLGATISNLNSCVTLAFNDNIFNVSSTNPLLKAEITFAVDGATFGALTEGDSVRIEGQNLIIDFAVPLTGVVNKIHFTFFALKDNNNVLVGDITTEAISAE